MTFTARQARALRAGAAAHFICTLLLLFVSLPSWAARTDFPGHQHPEGTSEHVHNLQQVGLLSAAIPLAEVGAAPVRSPVHALPPRREPRLRSWLHEPTLARGPPPRPIFLQRPLKLDDHTHTPTGPARHVSTRARAGRANHNHPIPSGATA